jgi:hypothetical protein
VGLTSVRRSMLTNVSYVKRLENKALTVIQTAFKTVHVQKTEEMRMTKDEILSAVKQAPALRVGAEAWFPREREGVRVMRWGRRDFAAYLWANGSVISDCLGNGSTAFEAVGQLLSGCEKLED